MASPFSIFSSRVSDASDPALREEIRAHTGSDEEVMSILRSIERFGGDATIRSYEMTPTTKRGRFGGALKLAWNVRAIRP